MGSMWTMLGKAAASLNSLNGTHSNVRSPWRYGQKKRKPAIKWPTVTDILPPKSSPPSEADAQADSDQ